MKTIIVAPLLAFSLALGFGPSPATAEEPAKEYRIATADLNLSSAKGRSRLDTRLRIAVKQACAPLKRPDVRGLTLYRQCVSVKTKKAEKARDAIIALATNPKAATDIATDRAL